MYRVTKNYGHELGLSACFRQPSATSHCRYLHGYALAFTFVFEATHLNHCNWVIDFGALRTLRDELKLQFDHKLLVAENDPELDTICSLQGFGIADVLMLPAVGCEAFAKWGWEKAVELVRYVEPAGSTRVRVVSCEVREHAGNSAIYIGPIDERDVR